MAPKKNKEKEPLERLRIWYGVSDLKPKKNLTGHWTFNQEPPNWQQIEPTLVRTTASRGTGVKFNRSVNDELLPRPKITIYIPSVYWKTIDKNIELSPSNGLEPATHEKGRVPIPNQLRPKEIFEWDRCASGWSNIYDHRTNPVNGPLRSYLLKHDKIEKPVLWNMQSCYVPSKWSRKSWQSSTIPDSLHLHGLKVVVWAPEERGLCTESQQNNRTYVPLVIACGVRGINWSFWILYTSTKLFRS